MADLRDELLDLTQRLLDSIAGGDWETYVSLCDPALTCFEPETMGHIVEGLDFHKFYFDNTHGKSVRCDVITTNGDAVVVANIVPDKKRLHVT